MWLKKNNITHILTVAAFRPLYPELFTYKVLKSFNILLKYGKRIFFSILVSPLSKIVAQVFYFFSSLSYLFFCSCIILVHQC